ncbi:hypothetical protein TNCV_4719811 [Trichonephila clavipes]|uniref:Uncharacterized protein n=1 Tax=Trichonephila clavipes TaxID=2585209 RepID=A0A8X7BF04_TRICX|nr:hypothetical protein TNCV_4719811 [Trichonephila clavipes]
MGRNGKKMPKTLSSLRTDYFFETITARPIKYCQIFWNKTKMVLRKSPLNVWDPYPSFPNEQGVKAQRLKMAKMQKSAGKIALSVLTMSDRLPGRGTNNHLHTA